MADSLQPDGDALVIDGTDQGFMTEVIEASKTQPVIVDFWAPWCGPCKTLGPMLEHAVARRAGQVKMVKINIDENPGVAGQLGVRSIPTVIGFNDGRPADGFTGAIPESQINDFIERLLSGTPAQAEIDQVLEMASEAFRQGDIGGAAQAYAAILNQTPEEVSAIAGLARCYLASGDPDKARETLDMAPADKQTDPEMRSVRTALDLTADAPTESAAEPTPQDTEPVDDTERFERAKAAVASGHNQAAVDHLLVLLGKDLGAEDGEAKALLLKVFEAEGEKSDITKSGRRRLSALMFN